MSVSNEQLEKLLTMGGCVIVDGMHFPVTTLERAAQIARASQGHLTIRNNGGHALQVLERIVQFGGKHVTLDLT